MGPLRTGHLRSAETFEYGAFADHRQPSALAGLLRRSELRLRPDPRPGRPQKNQAAGPAGTGARPKPHRTFQVTVATILAGRANGSA